MLAANKKEIKKLATSPKSLVCVVYLNIYVTLCKTIDVYVQFLVFH